MNSLRFFLTVLFAAILGITMSAQTHEHRKMDMQTAKTALSKKLALAGHDTEKYKATGDVYANLPGCCQYKLTK